MLHAIFDKYNSLQHFEFTVLFKSFRNEGFLLNPKVKYYSYESDNYANSMVFIGLQIFVTFIFFINI